MGYSSRILAESWESNLLYYAALADEIACRAGGIERAGSGVDPADRGSRFSPRTWRIGRRCCARCEWWATRCGRRRASRLAARSRQLIGSECDNRSEDRLLDSQTRLDLPCWSRWRLAQDRPTFRVKVDMVVLSFQVTDNKGHYMNGLKPKDFRILEDGIPQKIATFAEGNKPPVEVAADGTMKPIALTLRSGAKPKRRRRMPFVGTNVFVLFDTSNYMYRGFVYASDAIADFIRGLDRADSVAVYTYSRNLTRAAPLEQGAQRRDLRLAQSRRGRRFGACTTACC